MHDTDIWFCLRLVIYILTHGPADKNHLNIDKKFRKSSVIRIYSKMDNLIFMYSFEYLFLFDRELWDS